MGDIPKGLHVDRLAALRERAGSLCPEAVELLEHVAYLEHTYSHSAAQTTLALGAMKGTEDSASASVAGLIALCLDSSDSRIREAAELAQGLAQIGAHAPATRN